MTYIINIGNFVLKFFCETLNRVAWIYVLLPCVFIGGILFTVKNRGIQFFKFGYSIKNTVGKIFKKQTASDGAVTPLQAVTTALSATVGTGNIIGTGQAISLGGYGAVFWMWVASLLGMIIKYSEITLSVKFRERNENGDFVGGPMYYIKNGLSKRFRFLAVLFSFFAVMASFGIGNLAQANSISHSVKNTVNTFFPDTELNPAVFGISSGIVLALLVGFTLSGGIKRIGKLTEKLIPLMSILYIIFTLTVIFGNFGNIGTAFKKIFVCALNYKAVFGAASGIAVKEAIVWGLKRSAFSNEAGLGSAGIAHAAADTDIPVQQGLFGIFEVFADTVVICTLTALAIITSGIDIKFGIKSGSELITNAFSTVFGNKFASLFVAISLTLFAFSTIIGWSLYGTRCIEYLLGLKAIKIYRTVFVITVAVGTVISVESVWNIADTFNGLMAIPNFIALFKLSNVVKYETEKYFFKKRRLMVRNK